MLYHQVDTHIGPSSSRYMSRRPNPYIYCGDGDGVNPIYPRLIIGERRIAAAEAPEVGESPEARGEAEAPAEGPALCNGVMRGEPVEELGEAEGSMCGFSNEHPVSYMFEQELATARQRKAVTSGLGSNLPGFFCRRRERTRPSMASVESDPAPEAPP